MRLFLCCALAVCIGTLLGLFSLGEGKISGSISLSLVVNVIKVDRTLSISTVQQIKHRVKQPLRSNRSKSKERLEYGPLSTISKEEMVAAAKKLVPHTPVPGHILLGIADEETRLGANRGVQGLAIKNARTIKEQIVLDVHAWMHGLAPKYLKVSVFAAFGLTHCRPKYYAIHTGIEIDFGSTPVILLHGTDQYRQMSRSQKIASIKLLQHKLGLRGSEIDGVVGTKTLDAIQRSVGIRSLDSKVAKYRLVKRYYSDQVKIRTSKVRDKVWQRICLAQGKDPRKTEYFLPNMSDPLHALAYTCIHIEDDLLIAKGNLGVAISAYLTGIGDAKAGCKDGLAYQGRVVARSQKYIADLRS